jgi:hypothetical protein
MPSLLADDAEYAERCRMVLNSRRDRRARDQGTIVIKRDPLVGDRDDDLERTLRGILNLTLLR